MLKSAFREVHADRAAAYSKIYLKDANMVNLSAIDQFSITAASAITIDQVTKVAEKMHFGVRPALYIDGIKQ